MYQSLLVSKEPKEIALSVYSRCSSCGGFEIPFPGGLCTVHDSKIITTLPLTVQQMPWSLRRRTSSLAIAWDNQGGTHFDHDFYIKECLKYMIIRAPWGATTDSFLLQIGDELGDALEKLVPTAFGPSQSVQKLPTDIKKE